MFRKRPSCPDCQIELSEITYGLVTEKEFNSPGFVSGGCLIEEDAPDLACRKCGERFNSTELPRNFKTKFSWAEVDEQGEQTHEVDLETANEEELLDLASWMLEPRLELLRRGMSRQELDSLDDNWISYPLESMNQIFAVYDRKSHQVLQVTSFNSHERTHLFTYARPGLPGWDAVTTLKEYHSVVFAFKDTDVETWLIHTTDDWGDDSVGRETWGSPVIKAMWDNLPISPELFDKEAICEVPYWPHWFDPGQALSQFR